MLEQSHRGCALRLSHQMHRVFGAPLREERACALGPAWDCLRVLVLACMVGPIVHIATLELIEQLAGAVVLRGDRANAGKQRLEPGQESGKSRHSKVRKAAHLAASPAEKTMDEDNRMPVHGCAAS